MKLIQNIALAIGLIIVTTGTLSALPNSPAVQSQDQEFGIFFYESPSGFASRTNQDAKAYWDTWMNYIGPLQASGNVIAGSALQAPSTGIKVGSGQPKTLDSSAINLSGFLVIKAKSIDEAKEIAKKSPAIPAGGYVEVRPILPMSQHNGGKK